MEYVDFVAKESVSRRNVRTVQRALQAFTQKIDDLPVTAGAQLRFSDFYSSGLIGVLEQLEKKFSAGPQVAGDNTAHASSSMNVEDLAASGANDQAAISLFDWHRASPHRQRHECKERKTLQCLGHRVLRGAPPSVASFKEEHDQKLNQQRLGRKRLSSWRLLQSKVEPLLLPFVDERAPAQRGSAVHGGTHRCRPYRARR